MLFLPRREQEKETQVKCSKNCCETSRCCSLKNNWVRNCFLRSFQSSSMVTSSVPLWWLLPQEHWGLESAAFLEEDVVLTMCHKTWLLYKTTSYFPLRSKILNSSCSCSNWKSYSNSHFSGKNIPACNLSSWRAVWKSGQLIRQKLRSHWNET